MNEIPPSDLNARARAALAAYRRRQELPPQLDRRLRRRLQLERRYKALVVTAWLSVAAAATFVLWLGLGQGARMGGGEGAPAQAAYQREGRGSESAALRGLPKRRPSPHTAESAPVVPTVTPAPARPSKAKKPEASPSVVPRVPGDSLGAEQALLQRVHGLVAGGQAELALRELKVYRSRFPAGLLAQEAAALRAIAQCQVDEGAVESQGQGRRLGRSFLKKNPASPMAGQVERICFPVP